MGVALLVFCAFVWAKRARHDKEGADGDGVEGKQESLHGDERWNEHETANLKEQCVSACLAAAMWTLMMGIGLLRDAPHKRPRQRVCLCASASISLCVSFNILHIAQQVHLSRTSQSRRATRRRRRPGNCDLVAPVCKDGLQCTVRRRFTTHNRW